jgi:lambda family phage portal protein
MAVRTRSAKTTISTPAEQRAEADVRRVVTRINQQLSTYSRTMMAGAMATPFDALKPNANMPVVGNLGPQSTGYFLNPLVRFSRHLDRNDGFVQRGLNIRADATVDTGPWPEFKYQKLTDLFEEWMLECDRRGEMDMGQIVKKNFRNSLSGGEGWTTLHDEPMGSDLVVPLTIKGIELDQVDVFDNRMNGDNGNRIISGVELDWDDRPVAAWVLPYNPTDMHVLNGWKRSIRTPIADICHLYEKTEFSSVRGIPEIAPAIMRAIQTMRFDNATLTRMLGSTLNLYWAETTDRSAAGAKMPGEQDMDEWVSQMLIEPGALNVLPYGVKVTQNTAPEAGNTYEAFIKAENRYKAAVLGILYQEMTGDWTEFNDRAHRAATLSITRRINHDRQNMESRMLRKIAKRFVDRAYLSGAWIPPSGATQRDWYHHEWHWPAARYQNLYQEMNAWKLAQDADMVSPSQAISEVFGRDARKVDREIAADKARRAALAPGQAAGDIIVAEVAADELEVAQDFALRDDDAVGLRKPMKLPTRAERRTARRRK